MLDEWEKEGEECENVTAVDSFLNSSQHKKQKVTFSWSYVHSQLAPCSFHQDIATWYAAMCHWSQPAIKCYPAPDVASCLYPHGTCWLCKIPKYLSGQVKLKCLYSIESFQSTRCVYVHLNKLSWFFQAVFSATNANSYSANDSSAYSSLYAADGQDVCSGSC